MATNSYIRKPYSANFSDQYYTREEIDRALNRKADKSNTPRLQEINEKLAEIASTQEVNEGVLVALYNATILAPPVPPGTNIFDAGLF